MPVYFIYYSIIVVEFILFISRIVFSYSCIVIVVESFFALVFLFTYFNYSVFPSGVKCDVVSNYVFPAAISFHLVVFLFLAFSPLFFSCFLQVYCHHYDHHYWSSFKEPSIF